MQEDRRDPVRLALAGCLTLAVAVGIGRFVYTPILPHMMAGLSLDVGQAGLLASANFVGYLAGAALASLPGLAGARIRWMLGGLAVSALTTALSGVSDSLLFLLAVRLAAGIASACAFVFGIALVLDRLAALGRSRLSWLVFAGPGAGIFVSSVMVAALLLADAGWRTLWFAAAALSLAGFCAIVALLPPVRSAPAPSARSEAATIRRDRPRAFRRILASYALFGSAYVVSATFIVAQARSDPALASAETLIWPVVGLAAAPSVAAWSALARRIGDVRAYMAAALAEAVGVALSVLWPSPAGILIAAALLGGTFVAGTTLGLLIANHLSVGDSRRVVGIMTSGFGLGQIVGPLLAGWLHTLTGSYLVPMLTAAAALVAVAALAPGRSALDE